MTHLGKSKNPKIAELVAKRINIGLSYETSPDELAAAKRPPVSLAVEAAKEWQSMKVGVLRPADVANCEESFYPCATGFIGAETSN